ncbi:CepA family extended-spectrum class A beta-lactamase [Nibrella viscosa]|uniref:Beta-lactamase n=1 Tax=Nibrella viscosa TaxID=1084524 RepID=A0ABP8KJT0_9BACT
MKPHHLLLTLLLSYPLFAQSPLQTQLKQIAQTANGRVGIAATVIETGKSVALHGNERFPMQSVYKLPISMAVLQQVDKGRLKLDQRVKVKTSDFVTPGQHSPIRDKYPNGTELSLSELLRYNVSESDGTACDVLLRLIGGPKVVMQYLHSLGVKHMIVANTEKEIGSDNAVQYQNWSTPTDAVLLLKALQEGRTLAESSRGLLFRWITETPTGVRRIKALLPKGTVVAHKTGSSGTVNGVTAATNNIGLVTLPNGHHIAIAVFVSDAKADESVRDKVIARAAQAVYDAWSPAILK